MIKSVLVVSVMISVAIAQNTLGRSENQDSVTARRHVNLTYPNGTQYSTEIYGKHDGNRIVFPNEETNKIRTPTHDRTPVTDTVCLENELLYPGDNKGDWVCDCKPGYLHYPLTAKCYDAYTQGPCKPDELLVLDSSSTSTIPKCVYNKCGKGMVEFINSCFTLNEEAGCKHYKEIVGRPVILTVNPTTNGLVCASEDLLLECSANCCIGKNGAAFPADECAKIKPTVPAQKPQRAQSKPVPNQPSSNNQAQPNLSQPQQRPVLPKPSLQQPSQHFLTSEQPAQNKVQNTQAIRQQTQSQVQNGGHQTQSQVQNGGHQTQSQVQNEAQQTQTQAQKPVPRGPQPLTNEQKSSHPVLH